MWKLTSCHSRHGPVVILLLDAKRGQGLCWGPQQVAGISSRKHFQRNSEGTDEHSHRLG